MKRFIATILLTFGLWPVSLWAQVSGTVSTGDGPLAGVVVTDGYNFAVTDGAGKFTLELDARAPFVHIVTPAGYTAPFEEGTPVFYMEAGTAQSYDFVLQPYGNGKDWTLIATADPQPKTKKHFARFENETIPDLEGLIGDYLDGGRAPVGICLGDIVWDSPELFADYKRATATLGIPFYAVIGNHDHDFESRGDFESEWIYRSHFGPTYYAFVLGHDHFVVLDNIIYDTDKKYTEDVDEKQLQWLAKYMEFVPEDARVFICMHAPAYRYWNNRTMPSTARIISACRPRPTSFMSGHAHLNSNIEFMEGIIEHNVASAGGAWWTADWNKDGAPCGYQVFEGTEDGYSWYYKSTGYPADYQLAAYGRGAFPEYPNAVGAKIWNWDQEWKVEWYEDGVYKGEMTRIDSHDPDYLAYLQRDRDAGKPEVGAYKKPVKTFFFFLAEPSADAREIRVEATDRFGRMHRSTVLLSAED